MQVYRSSTAYYHSCCWVSRAPWLDVGGIAGLATRRLFSLIKVVFTNDICKGWLSLYLLGAGDMMMMMIVLLRSKG